MRNHRFNSRLRSADRPRVSRVHRNTRIPPLSLPDRGGLDPAMHAFPSGWIDANEGVDHRVEPGDDDRRWEPAREPCNRTSLSQTGVGPSATAAREEIPRLKPA